MSDLDPASPAPAGPELSGRAGPGEATAQPGVAGLSPGALVFLASAAGLFLELALIRWVSCEVRVFAYFKNLVLVACFLGFGVGCLSSRRAVDFRPALAMLVALCLLVRAPFGFLDTYGPRSVSTALSNMPGLMVFQAVDPHYLASHSGGLAYALAWTAALFLVLALLLVPFGRATGAAMRRIPDPLRAYSINVAGSLVGILGYTFATTQLLPPVCWFPPVALSCVWLSPERKSATAMLAATLALIVVLFPNDSPADYVIWSPYQKLAVKDGVHVTSNNIGYQTMMKMPELPPEGPVPQDRFHLPYVVRRPAGAVLIVGAGTGNDVMAALHAGAASVTAVEIDPVILAIGKADHPQHPYADPRVEVVLDDARHYLKTTDRTFDLIVFSHLDSHTVLSSYTNVRLDDYIYTVESLRDARRRMRPGGILYLSYLCEELYIAERLGRNLALAFGHDPLGFRVESKAARGMIQLARFLTGEPDCMPLLEAAAAAWTEPLRIDLGKSTVPPSSDDWPFLPLSVPHLPLLVKILSGVVLALSVGLCWRLRPAGEPFDGRVFWLGAAFMLVEVHNVSRLALHFGTTWQVNAWVIGAILGAILLANAACGWLRRRGAAAKGWIVVALFAALAAVYFVPQDRFLDLPRSLGAVCATLLLTSPIFVAGLLFADAFADSPAPGFALGWNVLGGVVGGMTESLSYVVGIPGLVPIAACFYGLAVLWPTRRAAAVATAAAPPVLPATANA
ncbi:MAG: methyltransferase domain-containing protein [Planctomycetes bacterium]|nr:methyltransferase domain-containing protein [Planctomycetota bacterium]